MAAVLYQLSTSLKDLHPTEKTDLRDMFTELSIKAYVLRVLSDLHFIQRRVIRGWLGQEAIGKETRNV